MHWIASVLGAVLAWFAWEVAGEAATLAIAWATRPLRRAYVAWYASSRWPWPPVFSGIASASGMVAGYKLAASPALGLWSVAVGFALCVGALLLGLHSAILWQRIGGTAPMHVKPPARELPPAV